MEYKRLKFDILIIGAGGAGLRAAIEALQEKDLKLAVVCKSLLGKAHTVMAEGGMAASLNHMEGDDNWEVHFRDTVKGAKLHNNWKMAEIHAKEAPDRVRELERFGAVLDRTEDGEIHQRPFGGHSFSRLAHVGDRTGLELIRTLQDKAVHSGMEVFMEFCVVKIFKDSVGNVSGALAYDRKNGEFTLFECKSVILATGGCGKCFSVQTNSWETTGDGHALAYETGAELIDMEFMQFHPTGMIWPLSVRGLLVSESVRGEGGLLKNSEGERFMFNYIPEAFKNDVADTEEEANAWLAGDTQNNRKPPELLTRDVVARAILAEVKAGRGSKHGGAYLDIAATRSPEDILKKLPSMYHQFKELGDVDITKEAMEVGPTAHYVMGGVKVDPESTETTVKGLFAAGECSGGLHGANRLGGNSLTDLLVFGKRAGEYAAKHARSSKGENVSDLQVREAIEESKYAMRDGEGENPFLLQEELKEMMNYHCGIVRNEEDLLKGLELLKELKERAKKVRVTSDLKLNTAWHASLSLKSLLIVSEMMLRAALERRESRGGHTRLDYQKYDEELGAQNIVLFKGENVEFKKEPIAKMPESYQQIMKKFD